MDGISEKINLNYNLITVDIIGETGILFPASQLPERTRSTTCFEDVDVMVHVKADGDGVKSCEVV